VINILIGLRRTALIVLVASAFLASSVSLAGNWPSWRGDGSGISSETGLPVRWDATTNVAWKVSLPGEGNSSPIVWGDRVFLTSSTDGGAKRHVLCIGANDGALLWQTTIDPGRETKTYEKSGYAAASVVTDGENVYAFFDAPGLVALDMAGAVKWTLDFGEFKSAWNMASSPILCDNKVIICCDHGGESFIAAVDKAKGSIVWKTPRQTGLHYATPLVIEVEGKKQIVVNAKEVIAYEPEKGAELWSCGGMKPTVVPSVVFANGLVYAASGRNGPIMAIDPTGKGDVTETHVRTFFPVGGPYVVSPIVYPLLFVPGDNGVCFFLNDAGKVLLKQRLGRHYTASPVAAENRIYWTTEEGETYVLDVSRVAADEPAVDVLAVNRIGERVLASPAISNGRIYLRSDKSLICIAGQKQVAPESVARERHSLDEIKKIYAENQAPEGPEVALRLQLLEDLVYEDDVFEGDPAPAMEFLKLTVQKDNHWDVSEEAAKVLGSYGKAAVPTLIELIEWKDWRPYPKIIAAGHLEALSAVEAAPTLVASARHNDSLVRIASLKALAAIGTAHEAEAATVNAALIGGLGDREGVVRKAAIDGLIPLADSVADGRDEVVAKLLGLAADKNPIVAGTAKDALLSAFKVPEEVVMMDEHLYGEQRREPDIAHVNAGPVSMKFQDGELRYLKVGDREVVRRIYFAVRDGRWDTVMPEFSKMDIKEDAAGFRISMAGRCRNDIADFTFNSTITGKADGTITFEFNGKPNMEFRSYRVGICVLYGAESLAGQNYEVVGADGAVTEGVFPQYVSRSLLANKFTTLRYTTEDGVEVVTSLAQTQFGMEDQRNFGDSSYKAFSGIPYKYPTVPKDEKGGQKLTVKVTVPENWQAPAAAEGAIAVAIGEAVPGAKMPNLLPQEGRGEGGNFMKYNNKPDDHANAEWIVMNYNPAAHMPDDDTYMENITAIVDQVASIRQFAPKAKFRIDPITIDSWYPRPGPDPRNNALFGAAWCARMVKCLALAGVDEAVLKVGAEAPNEYVGNVLKLLALYDGKPVLAAEVPPHADVDALAIQVGEARIVFLINKTDDSQQMAVTVGQADVARVMRIGLKGSAWANVLLKEGAFTLGMQAYEVLMVEVR